MELPGVRIELNFGSRRRIRAEGGVPNREGERHRARCHIVGNCHLESSFVTVTTQCGKDSAGPPPRKVDATRSCLKDSAMAQEVLTIA